MTSLAAWVKPKNKEKILRRGIGNKDLFLGERREGGRNAVVPFPSAGTPRRSSPKQQTGTQLRSRAAKSNFALAYNIGGPKHVLGAVERIDYLA